MEIKNHKVNFYNMEDSESSMNYASSGCSCSCCCTCAAISEEE